jgi:hypothetical protein
MIKFIKQLLGLGPSELAKVEEARSVFIPQTTNTKETVKEILTPPVKPTPVVTATYIETAKPVNTVKAISDSTPNAVAAATAPKPANKQRRPYRGRNHKANSATDGKGNNVVKLQHSPKKK